MVLADDDQSIDLDGWVTLDNRSGTSYSDAKLKLIAGDIHRAPTDGYVVEKEMAFGAGEAPAAAGRGTCVSSSITSTKSSGPVTVKDQQTKQIEFVTGSDVPAEKFFVYDGRRCTSRATTNPSTIPATAPPLTRRSWSCWSSRTAKTRGWACRCPRATLRVYKKDVDGSTLLIGEDAIDHTPKDEQVRLYIGDAFDIVGERVQTDFKVEYDEDWMEESYEITLRNHKDEDVEVRVVEHMFRWTEWKILEESHEHDKTDAQTIEFRVPVEADGETARDLHGPVRVVMHGSASG